MAAKTPCACSHLGHGQWCTRCSGTRVVGYGAGVMGVRVLVPGTGTGTGPITAVLALLPLYWPIYCCFGLITAVLALFTAVLALLPCFTVYYRVFTV